MNRGIRITLLLLATLAFVAHTVVAHHHHEGAVCFASSAEACDEHRHEHGKDTCDDECSAKVLFTTPQQISQTTHESDDRTVDLPIWAAIIVCGNDIRRVEISGTEFQNPTIPPLLRGYRLQASPRAPPRVS